MYVSLILIPLNFIFMAVVYNISNNRKITYFDEYETSHPTKEILDLERSARCGGEYKRLSTGRTGFVLIPRSISTDEEIDILIKIWNDNKSIVSSEYLSRISIIAAKKKIKVEFKLDA